MSPSGRVTTMLRMIDALDEERYRGMTHAAYRLYIHLVRASDGHGDLETELSLPQAQIMAWLSCTRQHARRVALELEGLGLIEFHAGAWKTKGDSGQAATYKLRPTGIVEMQEREHTGSRSMEHEGSRSGDEQEHTGSRSGAEREHTGSPIVPSSLPPEPRAEGARARAGEYLRFKDAVTQHLLIAHGFVVHDRLPPSKPEEVIKAAFDRGVSAETVIDACKAKAAEMSEGIGSINFLLPYIAQAGRPAPVARQRPHNDRGMLNQHSDHVAEAAMAKAMRERARARQGTSA